MDTIKNTSVKIQWLGHSAFKLISPAGKIIYIDPFLKHNSTTPDEFKDVREADYILLTHGHEDHVGDTLEIANQTGCKVLAQVELSHLLKKHGLNDSQRMEFNKGGTVQFDDFSVTLVSANHSSSFQGEYAGEAGGLVLRFNDDITFYHLGDTNIFADMEFYGEMYAPDVIAVPIGDHYTMGPYEASLCCGLLDAAYAIPIHFGTFPVLAGDPKVFKHETESTTATLVQILNAGDYFNPAS